MHALIVIAFRSASIEALPQSERDNDRYATPFHWFYLSTVALTHACLMLPALLAGIWVQPSRRRPAALLSTLAEAVGHLAVVALFVVENLVCGVGWSRWGLAGEPSQQCGVRALHGAAASVDLGGAEEEGSGAASASASAATLYSLLPDTAALEDPNPNPNPNPSPNPDPNPNPNPNPNQAALEALGMSTVWELVSACYVLLSGLFLLRLGTPALLGHARWRWLPYLGRPNPHPNLNPKPSPSPNPNPNLLAPLRRQRSGRRVPARHDGVLLCLLAGGHRGQVGLRVLLRHQAPGAALPRALVLRCALRAHRGRATRLLLLGLQLDPGTQLLVHSAGGRCGAWVPGP